MEGRDGRAKCEGEVIIIIIIKFFKVGLQNSSNIRINKDQLFTKTK